MGGCYEQLIEYFNFSIWPTYFGHHSQAKLICEKSEL